MLTASASPPRRRHAEEHARFGGARTASLVRPRWLATVSTNRLQIRSTLALEKRVGFVRDPFRAWLRSFLRAPANTAALDARRHWCVASTDWSARMAMKRQSSQRRRGRGQTKKRLAARLARGREAAEHAMSLASAQTGLIRRGGTHAVGHTSTPPISTRRPGCRCRARWPPPMDRRWRQSAFGRQEVCW